MNPNLTLFLIAVFVSLPACSMEGGEKASRQAAFPIYDNMAYVGKPDTIHDGLVVSNILYDSEIWPQGKNYGVLPSRLEFEALVRQHLANPGPLVLDIEKLPLTGSPQDARQHLKVLATLADWAHQAARGKLIGYYGTNTLSKVAPPYVPYARQLARHVDAFFPSMYTFDDDRTAWANRAKAMASEAHSLGPGKPVYFYLWPQYHDKTPKEFQYIDTAYWSFQLATSCQDSNGIVLWGPGKFDWNDTNRWWESTKIFVHEVRSHPGQCPSAG